MNKPPIKRNTYVAEDDIVQTKSYQELEKEAQAYKVFWRHAESEHREHLNAIAEKLKIEYIDYMSIDDKEPSIELCDNLKWQIKTIFKILEKEGIITSKYKIN